MDIFDTKSKISENEKQLNFYYDLNEKLQNKLTLLIGIYSFISIYIIRLIDHLTKINLNLIGILYCLLFIIFVISLIKSVLGTYNFYDPVGIKFSNQPRFFYEDVLQRYRKLPINQDDETLNEYVLHTFLYETELALKNNFKAFVKKREIYNRNLRTLLLTAFLYIILCSFVIFKV